MINYFEDKYQHSGLNIVRTDINNHGQIFSMSNTGYPHQY